MIHTEITRFEEVHVHDHTRMVSVEAYRIPSISAESAPRIIIGRMLIVALALATLLTVFFKADIAVRYNPHARFACWGSEK